MRPWRSLLAVLAAGLLALSVTGTAFAYGNSGGAQQLYQVTASMSCNNVAVCGSNGLGGFWAWGVFYADGTFDAEVTFCGHGPGTTQHDHVSGTYGVFDLGGGNWWIVITSETDVLTGLGHGQTIVIPSEFMPTAPAAKGHYSTAQILGFSAPGVTFQVTTTPMHT